MRLFSCQSCGQILFFENIKCERCGHALGYWPEEGDMHALEPAPDSTGDTWTALGVEGRSFRQCANAKYDVCNWLVDAGSADQYCAACRYNQTIPELQVADNHLAWRRIEMAKHRLFYTLFKFGLAQSVDLGAAHEPLVFRFLADMPDPQGGKAMTGHEDGVITIALAEADDAEREKRRKAMGEPYRTLLGHFRHEVAHFFWDRIVRDANRLDECRQVFGDEREDYGEALQKHYKTGAPADWQQNFVSTYATAHPWEDFAETWAHYLHIVDTLELAGSYGLHLEPAVDKEKEFDVDYAVNPYTAPAIEPVIDVWLPVSTSLNSLNRAMGKDEIYPFILSPGVIAKLAYMQKLVHEAAGTGSGR